MGALMTLDFDMWYTLLPEAYSYLLNCLIKYFGK